MTEDRRSDQIAARLVRVRRQIADAAVESGRDVAAVTLVGVTKTFPADDADRLVALGVTDLGESRDQEARVKAASVGGARWHFIGRLQRNKAVSVASYADVVHSVDRLELATALGAAAERAGRFLDVFCQVSIDGDPGRGGTPAAGLAALADAVAEQPRLRLAGLMAVPPLGADADSAYARLADIAVVLRRDHPDATGLSAGMSGDFSAAIRHGATHVRIGSALLGGRPPVVR